MQTIVIGHKNPDMDSICCALAYAEFKRLTGHSNVVAARAGATNERIDFVLHKFGVEAPILVNDVSPKVSDVMESKVICVHENSPIYDAIQLIDQKRLRGLPVVDGSNRCLGLLSASKITHHLFPSRDEASSTRIVKAALSDIVTTFGGALASGTLSTEPSEKLLMVGAMAQDTFVPRLSRYRDRQVILFVGDRPHIQQIAIDERLHAVVVTGGSTISPEIRNAAHHAGVTLIASPHDTATTVLLARGGVRVKEMLQPEYVSFHCATPLEEAIQRSAESAQFSFPVLDDSGKLAGILSKSDFLKPVPRQLILVDHNELGQAVRGADKIPVIEILDHHKLGGFASHTPIHFWNNPVGSTSSIVALCFKNAGIPIPKPVAGLLLSGLISDTLLLTSPTTTAVDRQLLDELSQLADVDAATLAREIFSVGSPLLTMSPEQAIGSDAKLYEENGHRFNVAQIEEISFAHFQEKRDGLLEALEKRRLQQSLLFSALLVTDVNEQNSLLLLRGAESFLKTIDYNEVSPFVWDLPGVVSRKKQLLPYLLRCVTRMRS